MSWRERLLRSLPFVLVILGAFGVLITDELWVALVSLAGVWLLPSPVGVPSNVSRETVIDPKESVAEYIERTTPNVSRETITVPCAFLHGSAESHVEGCEGWRFMVP